MFAKRLSEHFHTRRARHAAAPFRERQTPIGLGRRKLVGIIKGRQWPGEVEQIKAGEDHKADIFHHGAF